MATKTTVLSPNASVISFSQGASLSEIISAVNDEIVKGHGWAVHDANAGQDKICYKALNKDGQTYKYFILDYSTAAKIKFSAHELWDEVAHVGTNNAILNQAYCAADLLLTDRGNIYLFISPRWLAFCVKQFSSAVIYATNLSCIGGIFEIARDNPDDTVATGCPPFCVLTTASAGEYTNTDTLLLPRSLSGSNNQVGELSTIFGKTSSTSKLATFTPNIKNPFSDKDWAITPYVHGPDTEVRGRIFGLKVYTQNSLFFMDKVSVNCDQDFMYDADAATPTDHFVVPGGMGVNGAYSMRFLIPC